MEHKYPYRWTLKDAKFTKDKGKVFSCFACGGGSTMGYKLAGFDVIGDLEIDPRMNAVYVQNHHPKYNFCEDIREFKKRDDLPEELYHLDILDSSPPCSSFSAAGVREEGWGKEKKFREGQVAQVLDTLFFDTIDLVKKLQPKVFVAENVKGLLQGNAKPYVARIYKELDEAGYAVTHQLLDASMMGVPQRRERVFFTAIRKDLLQYVPTVSTLFEVTPEISLSFSEPPIYMGEFADYQGREVLSKQIRYLWENRKEGDESQKEANIRLYGKEANFGQKYLYPDKVCPTLTAKEGVLIYFDKPRYTSVSEVRCISTFPQDYDFLTESAHYVCGMSVPPVMMAQVANKIFEQWLSKIPE